MGGNDSFNGRKSESAGWEEIAPKVIDSSFSSRAYQERRDYSPPRRTLVQ